MSALEIYLTELTEAQGIEYLTKLANLRSYIRASTEKEPLEKCKTCYFFNAGRWPELEWCFMGEEECKYTRDDKLLKKLDPWDYKYRVKKRWIKPKG